MEFFLKLSPRVFLVLAAFAVALPVAIADKSSEAHAERIALRDAIMETMKEPERPVRRLAEYCGWMPVIDETGKSVMEYTCKKVTDA